MSVVIRLARHGAPKQPFYRIIAAQKGSKRDTSFIEVVGTMNPMTKPATVVLKVERVKHWIGVGAQPSETVGSIIKKQIPNLLEERTTRQLTKLKAARKARKARMAKKSGSAKK